MSLTSKRKYRSSDSSQPSPDSKQNKFCEEEFNMSEQEGEEQANSVEKEVPSLGDIWNILLQIKENTNHLNTEFEHLKTSFAIQDKEISNLKEANNKLVKENTALKSRMGKIEIDIKAKEKKLTQISHQHDSLEQYTRKNSLEIIGVPVMEDQSCEDITRTIAGKIGVDLKPEDIEISHRLKRKSSNDTTSSPIIVKFASHKKKTELYRARVKLKGKSLKDFFPASTTYSDVTSNIFINENLTFARRKILAAALKKKHRGELHSVWTLDGKIFTKATPTSNPEMTTALPDEPDEP